MTNEQKYKALVAKIVEVVPDIMDIDFGCIIKDIWFEYYIGKEQRLYECNGGFDGKMTIKIPD